ncbi:hypothetical protein [Streptomyces glaucus]|uniref:Uncharacterized protein n=1 Tax=Streptomyces glaucus TaxID=284029 RepID=A0ABN3JVI5_9ACTN
MSTLISHAETAAPLAALLPARRGVPWTVEPAPQLIRAGGAMSRLVQGNRALDVVELGGRVEVYADRDSMAPVAPDVVVTETGPDPVAELSALVLRIVLPRMDREAARATRSAHGRDQVVIDTTADLNEIGFSLIDHGAHLDVVAHPDGVGLTWTLDNGAEWGLWAITSTGNLTVSYEGPVSGLYGVLPVLLPAAGPAGSDDVGSGFTRHLTDRFPQVRAVDAHSVEFGHHDDVNGYIALPASDEPATGADSSRRVAAHFANVGADLLLSLAPLLI